jgi:lysophospholipase L1-like esterase
MRLDLRLDLRLVCGALWVFVVVGCSGSAFNAGNSAGNGGADGGTGALSGGGAGGTHVVNPSGGGGVAGTAAAGAAAGGSAGTLVSAGGSGLGGAGGTGGSKGDGGSSGSGVGGSGGSGGHPTTLRLMPLGDGITATTCYRAKLWQKFADNRRTEFDFVGSRNAGDACNVSASYDKDNEGHGGYQITDVLKATSTGRPASADAQDPYDASAKDLSTWFDGHPIDILLVHMGSNDILKLSASPESILNAYTAIVTRVRISSPKVAVFVAQLLPMQVASCSTCNSQIQALNQAIPAWAAMTDTPASRVRVVNQYAGFDVANTLDGIRPDETGSQVMADKWYDAIVAAFP